MTAQQIAKQLVDTYPDDALSLVFEVAKLVAAEQAARKAVLVTKPRLLYTETPKIVMAHCASKFGIQVAELRSGSRTRRVVAARHLAMYLLRVRGELSLTEIGDAVGCDHSSVLHALRNQSIGESCECAEVVASLDEAAR